MLSSGCWVHDGFQMLSGLSDAPTQTTRCRCQAATEHRKNIAHTNRAQTQSTMGEDARTNVGVCCRGMSLVPYIWHSALTRGSLPLAESGEDCEEAPGARFIDVDNLGSISGRRRDVVETQASVERRVREPRVATPRSRSHPGQPGSARSETRPEEPRVQGGRRKLAAWQLEAVITAHSLALCAEGRSVAHACTTPRQRLSPKAGRSTGSSLV